MATSESDDFESADEELAQGSSTRRGAQRQPQWSSPSAVDSESDDGAECVPRTAYGGASFEEKPCRLRMAGGKTSDGDAVTDGENVRRDATRRRVSGRTNKNLASSGEDDASVSRANVSVADELACEKIESKSGASVVTATKSDSDEKAKTRQRSSQQPRQHGMRKLGTKIPKESIDKTVSVGVMQAQSVNTELQKDKEEGPTRERSESSIETSEDNRLSARIREKDHQGGLDESLDRDKCMEMDMPEELKSDKTFKEIFKPQGWESIGNDIELPDDLSDEKLQPVLDKLSSMARESENASNSWGSWGSWGVSSLINTATVGVSTLTSHVSHGLTLLEETIGVPDPSELAKMDQQEELKGNDDTNMEEKQPLSTFGFGNLMSGVSSITKLVETTGSKVMTGGLDTLEAIGKKTMEVLQEGDPGLKKKRAFFTNENKPILSQILREAKEKAETEEKTLEEKQSARRVHFESLFDDYQGLVHLEALEMLSKQSNIKIQQYLVGLDTSELSSVQETLEEVKELCDLGEEDDEEKQESVKDLKTKLADACHDLGVNITYEKLCSIWQETESYLASPSTHSDQEFYEQAISTLAQFTALSVERFHKTAELLLIKERRSTVNEADALVQLTRVLSDQIGLLAAAFCNILNEVTKSSDKPDKISANITTIFLEATNASSYIQDAFRLLIPILQVGAI